MAIKTVTAAGGTRNWNDVATWVGGVIPTNIAPYDDIVIPSGAGNLIINVNSNCSTIVFQTGYINTFTIANSITLTVSGTTITLISGMTYDQTTTGILSTRGNQAAITITFAGIIIPNLTLGKTTSTTTQTVTISGATPTIKNLVINNGFNAVTVLSGTPITITLSLSVIGNFLTNNTGQITFIGTCTINCASSLNTISGGFNVTTGSSLQMLSNIYLAGGTITFTGSATLINTGLFTLFCSTAVTFNTSTVNWYNITLTAQNITHALSSALNITNNLTLTVPSGTGLVIATSTFAINISGSLIGSGQLRCTGNGIINMLGTGAIDMADIANSIININGTGTYTIGSATNPTLIFAGAGSAINLIGTSTAQVYSTTTHTIRIATTTLTTNNTATGANIVGGSQIIWGNINASSSSISTLTYDTIALGNFSSDNANINGGRLYVGGNLIANTAVGGTSTIELNGSSNTNWSAGTYQNSIVVNKSSGATVTTAAGTILWGLANRTLTMNSAVNFLTNSTTFTLSGNPLTINNSYGSSFFNLTIPISTTLTLGGGISIITSNLTLNGATTFTGTFGWDCNNLICSTAGTFNITLQQGVTYRTRTGVSITGGTSALRPTMTSSGASNAIWTLDFGATQSLIYVNGTRIDSSGGQTVWSFGVSAANISTTINWNPGVPLRTVAYTFVN